MTTSQPTSSSELQLYRVLQRANLLQYYDTFISQGGDDVQQLCEAGEEEFLEIMALVGMASKPLHVRRLQKALQEWVTNPTVFNQALANSSASSGSPGSSSPAVKTSQTSSDSTQAPVPVNIVTATGTWKPKSTDLLLVPSPVNREDELKSREDRKSPVPTPVLVEDQIAMIALSAEQLVPTLDHYEPKPMNMKKEINREIDYVIKLPFDTENRMDLIRKYSAIYGRFDSKRKGEKPMSMHEISVNEAAAQICKFIPALMTRRDELFPLARQVVRDSGYQYSKGHSRAQSETPVAKRMKLDLASSDSNGSDFDKTKAEGRLKDIVNGLQQIADIQEQIKLKIEEAKEQEEYEVIHGLQKSLEECASEQLKLLTEQAEIKRREKLCHKKSLEPNGLDDNDSANYSNTSSPQAAEEKPDILNVPAKKNVEENRQFVHETLFDEGLRIAQQYGMADFAEELTELKPKFVGADKTETGAIDYNTAEESESDGNATDQSSHVVNGSGQSVS